MTRLRRAVARAFTPVRCAWCIRYQSRWSAFLAGQGFPVSDGICTDCEIALEAESDV